MGKFIVMEGLDGSGKSTQADLLTRYFKDNGISYQYLHFPRLAEPVVGGMIAKFLRGEYGGIETTDPYFVALLYATDRCHAKETLTQWIKENDYVLIDRYVASNIAFQCAKIEDTQKKEELREWILRLEYEYHQIPKPDKTLFLQVPFAFVERTLREERAGEDRSYLKNAADIHEDNLELQRNVEREFIKLSEVDSTWRTIRCGGRTGGLLAPEEVHREIIKAIAVESK